MEKEIVKHLLEEFKRIEKKRDLKNRNRRIGSELKFPLVKPTGGVVDKQDVDKLWDFLSCKGWTKTYDRATKRVTGATKQGHMNEHIVSCETGFCKVEFSLAHTDDLFQLKKDIKVIQGLMKEFGNKYNVEFLSFGLQPVIPPSDELTMKKGRNLFWDELFGGNKHIEQGKGTDVHLFTISASNQTHIDVTVDEAVKAINVFNGLAGAQVSLTANSNVWKGKVSAYYKCLGEMFWDWWLKEEYNSRYGVPDKKFDSLEDYFLHILSFKPVYAKRQGLPVGLPDCPSFMDFYLCSSDNPRCDKAGENQSGCGMMSDGSRIDIKKQAKDIDQHFTFFWHNARLSRHFTLENRINDQQPQGEWITIPALTLGITENLDKAWNLVERYPWKVLQESRIKAAEAGLEAKVKDLNLADLAWEMLLIAQEGLKKRGLGEEEFLEPLFKRIRENKCPADTAAEIVKNQGIKKFVDEFKVK